MPKITVSAVGAASAILDRLTGVPSQWGGLSPTLLANLYPLKVETGKDGKKVYKEDVSAGTAIKSPASDINFEQSLNWQSPFEQSGPENKAPSLMAIIQSGQLGSFASTLEAALGTSSATQSAQEAAATLEGRTGITKLNSTQVFSGAPPAKINLTLHFRAMANPLTEVEAPFMQLLQWALPKKLAAGTYLEEAVKTVSSGGKSFVDVMFPSQAPTLVGFKYGGKTFSPMVIEFISAPLDSHLSLSGRSVYLPVQITLCSLFAIDSEDVKAVFKRSGFL